MENLRNYMCVSNEMAETDFMGKGLLYRLGCGCGHRNGIRAT